MTPAERRPMIELTLRVVNSIGEVGSEAWDACANTTKQDAGNGPALAPCAPTDPAQASVLGDRYNPFISHDFLSALELSQSVRPRTGWQPMHLLAEDAQRGLFGAVPCYVKSHSRGEYVFDDGWAEAYERAGGSYYPKLQVSVPFTPATGRRLLARPGPQAEAVRAHLADALAAGISVHWLTGSDLTESVWDTFFAFYMETGSRKWGRPYLTREFYSLVGEKMRDHILLVMAKRNGRWIAGAINFIGSDTLFGRHWGALEHHPFLHFELCYYQAIQYAIEHKLARVEAGAQGEHKISRGYLPTVTYSAHYIADPAFRQAVADYLKHE